MTTPDASSRTTTLTWKDRAAAVFLALVVLLAMVAALRGVWPIALALVLMTATMVVARRAAPRS